MKPYSPQNHLTTRGLIILGAGSIALGFGIGLLAYFISNFVYLLVGFPLVVGFAAALAYGKLVLLSKVRHFIISTLFGVVAGLCIAIAFYGASYLILRRQVVAGFQEKYQIDARTASEGFDSILIEDTGSSGLLGYMKLRASEGEDYTNYLIVGSTAVHAFSFSLKSTTAWVYWILETLLFTIPIAWWGYDIRRRLFCKSANNWYALYSTQIGSVRVEDKENLLSSLQTNDFHAIGQLIAPEGQLKHPLLEIYRQLSENKKGDVLLTIQQTARKDQTTVKRTLVNQWEAPQSGYQIILDALEIKQKESEQAQHV